VTRWQKPIRRAYKHASMIGRSRLPMQQRFYPYTPHAGGVSRCEAAHCENVASWWDATHDAVWCDFHATAEVVSPVRVQCAGCFEWYNPTQVRDGVCGTCRSVMPLMWPDEEVKHDV